MKSKKKTVKKAASPAPTLSTTEASLTLDAKTDGLEAVFGAAYLMMDKAYVSLSGDRAGKITVALRAKDPKAVKPKALAEEFLSDLVSQKVRWAISRNNQPVREFVAEQAVLIANGTVPPPSAAQASPEAAAEQLTDEQRAEIEKLISEVESEIKTMNDKKVVSDPKGIKASWEEKQEQENKA
jgi:His-Xaa-Ser system protein HxsD